MNNHETLHGGCLCGQVRYQVLGTPIDAGYCHCRMCQLANGAPAVAWGTFPYEAFTLVAGKLVTYASSAEAERRFCSRCGSQIAFCKRPSPRMIDITLASLDDPTHLLPQYHIWTMSRIGWFETTDTLPRHKDGGPHPSL
ncbi:MAG: GFA family protein [Gammaproteobacteria bacterium]